MLNLRKVFLQTFIFFILLSNSIFSQKDLYIKAHSHNDYDNAKPLLNALSAKAKSVEADIFFLNNKFFVCHNIEDTNSNNTLDKIYLNPLSQILNNKNSEFYFDYELFLMIDIKKNGNLTFEPLKELLKNYSKYLSSVENDTLVKRNIRIILSGSRPIDSVINFENRFMFLDGRLSDINKNESENIYPLISDSGEELLKYIKNDNEEIQLSNLKKLVKQIHSENKLVRFWGIPDNQKYWKKQLEYGVDLIGTDNPLELNKFFFSILNKAGKND